MATSKCEKGSKTQYAGVESLGLLRRMALYSWFVLPMLASSASWGQRPQQSAVLNKYGRVELQALDSATGYMVSSATIKWDTVRESAPSALSHSGISSSNGQFSQELSPSEYAFEISAPGYQPMRTHFDITLGSVIRANINLDPVDLPTELRDNVIASELRDGYELLHGYIVDRETHLPLAGVKLRLQESDVSGVSDSRGYFQLYAGATSTENASKPEDFPAPDTLTATLSGYKTYILTGIRHVSGSQTVLRIALASGTGVTNERIDQRPLLPAAAVYCPDGQTGQPTMNWPCMLDPIATGSTGSGHGRGMSQWGSQFWARGLS